MQGREYAASLLSISVCKYRSESIRMIIETIARRNLLFRLVCTSFVLFRSNSHCAMAFAATPSSGTPSCAVVGVGVLGTSLCKQLLALHDKEKLKELSITGITKTNQRHNQILNQINAADKNRLELVTMDQALQEGKTYDHMIFCAPPSGFDNYAEAVQQAVTSFWNRQGTLVFTSSGGMYVRVIKAACHGDEDACTHTSFFLPCLNQMFHRQLTIIPTNSYDASGSTVTEQSPTGDPSNPRVARLLSAEAAVLEAGGCVLRLAGLYDLQRGAHNYWFSKAGITDIAGGPDGIINQLHYDDAACACIAALLVDRNVVEKQVFLISDGNPLTRRQICESTRKAAVYRDMTMPSFGSSDGKPGKVYDGSWSNDKLQWKPKYASFDKYMASQA